jgi:hypothetical protein
MASQPVNASRQAILASGGVSLRCFVSWRHRHETETQPQPAETQAPTQPLRSRRRSARLYSFTVLPPHTAAACGRSRRRMAASSRCMPRRRQRPQRLPRRSLSFTLQVCIRCMLATVPSLAAAAGFAGLPVCSMAITGDSAALGGRISIVASDRGRGASPTMQHGFSWSSSDRSSAAISNWLHAWWRQAGRAVAQQPAGLAGCNWPCTRSTCAAPKRLLAPFCCRTPLRLQLQPR